MKRIAQPLVIANWKMNPETLSGAKALFSGIKTQATKHRTRAIIAPPFVYLGPLAELHTGRYLSLAAQHVHAARSGTFTGEVSAPMLRSMKVTHVIRNAAVRVNPMRILRSRCTRCIVRV